VRRALAAVGVAGAAKEFEGMGWLSLRAAGQ
jgi:hypothetical protein